MDNQSYRSVLPHEPQPTESRGFVHIQGALLPKIKIVKPINSNTKTKTKTTNEEHYHEHEHEHEHEHDAGKIIMPENVKEEEVKEMLLRAFNSNCKVENDGNGTSTSSSTSSSNEYLPADSVLLQMPSDCRDAISVTVFIDHIKTQAQRNGENEVKDGDIDSKTMMTTTTTVSITKAGIEYRSPSIARRVTAFIRKHKLSPMDIFHPPKNYGNKSIDDEYPHQCTYSYQYSTKHIQATQVTQVPIPSSDIAWPRVGMPKFRRLLMNNNNEVQTNINMEKVNLQRSETRFVFMTNIIDMNNINVSDVNNNNDNDGEYLISNTMEKYMFQDALRDAIQPYCTDFNENTYSDSVSTKASGNLPPEIFLPSKKQLSPYKHCHIGTRSPLHAQALIRELQGKEIKLKIKTTNSSVDDDNDDGSYTITTGKLFLDFAAITQRSAAKSNRLRKSGRNGTGTGTGTGADLDAMDIPGQPSRPECTSTTDAVVVPGLICVQEFITQEEEQILLGALQGPNAPWAPSQQNFSRTGSVRRRVQHYGYVFDYETADVLRDRDREESKEGTSMNSASNCPPMPCLPSQYDGCTNAELKSCIELAVKNGDGWTALAAVIEKVRRHTFRIETNDAHLVNGTSAGNDVELPSIEELDKSSSTSSQSLSPSAKHPISHKDPIEYSTMQFKQVNQLTVNEYKQGQGIGTHVDTESAFGDGLISLSMGSDCVMEFRSKDGIKKLVHLPPRSLIIMSGPARYSWSHQIVTRMTDCVDNKVIPRKCRVSLTLRTAITLPDGDKGVEPLDLVESCTFPPTWGDSETCEEMESDIATPETERSHVHAVYDAIATQWHHTRGKRGVLWPGASQFLKELPMGSIVADVGCGDGKYFPAIWEAGSYVIGTDISEPLLQTSIGACSDFESKVGPENRLVSRLRAGLNSRPAVAVADCMHIPMKENSCDAAICIAVMHHLSTTPRRLQCLRELSRIVKVGGRINVQAWALEQDEGSKRKFAVTDAFVPFNAQPRYLDKVESTKRKGIGNEKAKCQGVAEMYSEAYDGAEYDERKGLVVFQRYCHMYREGELEDLVSRIDTLKMVQSGFESGNYFIILEVQ